MNKMNIANINVSIYDSSSTCIYGEDIPKNLIDEKLDFLLPTLGTVDKYSNDIVKLENLLANNYYLGTIFINILYRAYCYLDGKNPPDEFIFSEHFYSDDYLDYRSDKGEDYDDLNEMLVKVVNDKIDSEKLDDKIITSLNYGKKGKAAKLTEGYFYRRYRRKQEDDPITIVVKISYSPVRPIKKYKVVFDDMNVPYVEDKQVVKCVPLILLLDMVMGISNYINRLDLPYSEEVGN